MTLLHFVGPGDGKEYFVITDEPQSAWDDYASPGFRLMSTNEVSGNVSGLPMYTEFWRRD